MKKFWIRYGNMMAAVALVFTAFAAEKVCFFCFHQPKFPDAAKKLRKF